MIVKLITVSLLCDWWEGSIHSVDTLDEGIIHLRYCHSTQNGMQLKTYELFISGFFHIYSNSIDLGWLKPWKVKLWIRENYCTKFWPKNDSQTHNYQKMWSNRHSYSLLLVIQNSTGTLEEILAVSPIVPIRPNNCVPSYLPLGLKTIFTQKPSCECLW
jgi:hypothetical protein